MAGQRARALLLAAGLWCCLWLANAAELDLLEALLLPNTSWPGVTPAVGLQPLKPAYSFQGDFRGTHLPQEFFSQAVELLKKSPEFTVLATLRQDQANSGTIMSFSHGYNRYLEVQSSGRRDEVRFHYVPSGSSTLRVETFPYRLADGIWHKLALTVSGAQAELLVDCHPLYKRIMPSPDRNFSQPQLGLWLGQRNSKHSLFKGILQDVRLVNGPHGYLAQCPGLDSQCPTCGQFSLLQATVQELTNEIQELAAMLRTSENRLTKLEECDCQKSCYSNGTIHADGATWQIHCNKCACVHGEITCRPVECQPAECRSPVLHDGDCCPTCLKQCYLKGVLYDHGEKMTPRECAECICKDGNMQCTRIDPEVVCPLLPCEPTKQFSVPGECCKFCPDVNYCGLGHSCDENATCMNLNTNYTCKCNQGFQGDGHNCDDVDECAAAGGLYGHHCHAHTDCVNIVGSYVCSCRPGYMRSDKFNCVEVDECTDGSHTCHMSANCHNTYGSYICHCIDGYTGDGFRCDPICTGDCLNGGTCASPEKCECRPGFTGRHCERDLDECTTKTHRCPSDAYCVNMPGWYYCKCNPGFRSVLASDNTISTDCQDIDECLEGLHTCHPSAYCINTEGSFRCECRSQECKLDCIHTGREIADGARWMEIGGCRACSCHAGVLSCAPATCECSRDKTDAAISYDGAVPNLISESTNDTPIPKACCPQCDPRHDCQHQELHHIHFRSGERWLYQCQTCECLLGEVDCWELECPNGIECCDSAFSNNGNLDKTVIINGEILCSHSHTNVSMPPCLHAAHRTAPDCTAAFCASLGEHKCGAGDCLDDVGDESDMATEPTTASAGPSSERETVAPSPPLLPPQASRRQGHPQLEPG